MSLVNEMGGRERGDSGDQGSCSNRAIQRNESNTTNCQAWCHLTYMLEQLVGNSGNSENFQVLTVQPVAGAPATRRRLLVLGKAKQRKPVITMILN